MRARVDELGPVRDAAAGLARRAGVAVAGAAVAIGALLVLVLSLLPPRLFLGRGSPLPAIGAALLLALAVCAARVARRTVRTLRAERLAREAEAAGGLGAGDLLGALELDAARTGESASLAGLHRGRVAESLRRATDRDGGDGPRALFPDSSRRWSRRLRLSVAGVVLAAALVVSAGTTRPGPTAEAVRALLAPWRTAFAPPPPPIRLAPGNVEVERGTPLEVRVSAPGRSEVELAWRVAGERPSRVRLPLDEAGRTAARTAPVMAPILYWASDGRSASDTFAARPRDPLLLTALRARLTFPAYLGRPAETHEAPLPVLLVPEGTVVHLEGEATRPLARAALESAHEDRVEGRVDGAAFSLRLRPRASGRWEWVLEGSAASGAAVRPEPLELVVVADERPSVEVVFPGGIGTLDERMSLALVVDVRDDLGVRRVELVSWLAASSGDRSPPRMEEVAGVEGEPRRTVLRPLLDLDGRGLLPGDTAYYLVRAFDANPAHGAGVSDTLLAVLPSIDDLRGRAAAASESAVGHASEAAAAAERLRETARDAARRAAAGEPEPLPVPSADGRRGEGDLGFGDTREGRRALEEGRDLERRLEELEEELAGLERDLAGALAADPPLREELRRLGELVRELRESGLGERLAELERALRELDARAVGEQLARLGEESEELAERIERSVGLLERMALEQALEAARSETRRLASEQRATADGDPADPAWAGREERLAGEAEQLAASLDSLRERLAGRASGAAADSVGVAGERAREAGTEMRRAVAPAAEPAGERPAGEGSPPPRSADSATATPDAGDRHPSAPEASGGSPSPPPEASEGRRAAARRAAGALEEAADALEAGSEALARQWRAEAADAVARARSETLELAREEARLAEELAGPSAGREGASQGRQAALRQGLENLRRSLGQAAGKTALVDPGADAAAARAAEGMDDVLRDMAGSGSVAGPGRQAAEDVVEALNDLALRLLASEQAIEGAASGTGAEEALERLAALARRQEGLAREGGRAAAPGGPAGDALTELARRLARGQAEVAEGLRRLEGREEIVGRPEELAREAERLADRLAAGRVDRETVERQRGLFRRMLDAGRSLEREELDPDRRESRVGRDMPREAPVAPVDEGAGLRFPHPGEALLRELPPAYRHMIFDYFDRLNGRRADPPPDRP